jgi:hypothetical protein
MVKKLTQWGKLTVISSPENADLVLKIEETRKFGAWKGKGAGGSALLTDRDQCRNYGPQARAEIGP